MAASLLPGFALAAAYIFRFLIPPRERRTEEVLVGKLDAIPQGGSRLLKGVHGNDLIAVRLADDQVRAFSSVCTHLGCFVQWDAVAGNFLCPCHMGRFDTGGQVIEGPPPAPLPSFPVRVEGGNLFIVVPVQER